MTQIQIQPGKSSVAWFKLAEFVGRKEKEKALGIYRLLMHYLSDEAIAAQLEGDLLFSFADEKAIDCYTRAALLYEKQDRLLEAVSLYELLYIHGLLKAEYNARLLELYRKGGFLLKLAAQQDCIARQTVTPAGFEILSYLTPSDRRSVLLCILKTKTELKQSTIHEIIKKEIDELVTCSSPEITPFLASLKVLSADAYNYAQQCVIS